MDIKQQLKEIADEMAKPAEEQKRSVIMAKIFTFNAALEESPEIPGDLLEVVPNELRLGVAHLLVATMAQAL